MCYIVIWLDSHNQIQQVYSLQHLRPEYTYKKTPQMQHTKRKNTIYSSQTHHTIWISHFYFLYSLSFPTRKKPTMTALNQLDLLFQKDFIGCIIGQAGSKVIAYLIRFDQQLLLKTQDDSAYNKTEASKQRYNIFY